MTEKMMHIVDAINHIYGRDTLFSTVQGMSRSWTMRQSKLSTALPHSGAKS